MDLLEGFMSEENKRARQLKWKRFLDDVRSKFSKNDLEYEVDELENISDVSTTTKKKKKPQKSSQFITTSKVRKFSGKNKKMKVTLRLRSNSVDATMCYNVKINELSVDKTKLTQNPCISSEENEQRKSEKILTRRHTVPNQHSAKKLNKNIEQHTPTTYVDLPNTNWENEIIHELNKKKLLNTDNIESYQMCLSNSEKKFIKSFLKHVPVGIQLCHMLYLVNYIEQNCPDLKFDLLTLRILKSVDNPDKRQISICLCSRVLLAVTKLSRKVSAIAIELYKKYIFWLFERRCNQIL